MKIRLKSSILHLQSLENVTMYLDEAIFEVLTEDLEEKVEPKEMKGRTRKFYTFV